jgi:hypothetical protein
MYDNLLTIGIPTYQRSKFLDSNLQNLYVLSKKYIFNIFVSDNNSSDDTIEVLHKWEKILPRLTYYSQSENVKYDRNLNTCFKHCNTEYIWAIGDSIQITEKTMNKVFNALIEKRPTAIVIDVFSQINFKENKVYTNVKILIEDLGWYITLLSSCIYSKKMISNDANIIKYFDTNFLQVGAFFEYLANCENFEVLLLCNSTLEYVKNDINENKLVKKSWQNNTFSIFARHWFEIIMSLPTSIPMESKLKCVADHDKHTHIFNYKKIFRQKILGDIDFCDYKESRRFIPFITNTPVWMFDIISMIPKIPTKYLLCIKKFKNGK